MKQKKKLDLDQIRKEAQIKWKRDQDAALKEATPAEEIEQHLLIDQRLNEIMKRQSNTKKQK